MCSVEELKTFKVTELKQLCKARNLDTSGKKVDLIARLKMQGLEEAHGARHDDLSDLQVGDSASQLTSRCSNKSRASTSSSSASSRAKLAARRASLEVKAKYLSKQQELEYRLERGKMEREMEKMKCEMQMKDEQVKLQMELDKLKLEAEISATAAEEEVLVKLDKNVKLSECGSKYHVPQSAATQSQVSSPSLDLPQPPVLTPMTTYRNDDKFAQSAPRDQAHGTQGQPRSSTQNVGIACGESRPLYSQTQHNIEQGQSRSQLNPLADEFKFSRYEPAQDSDLHATLRQQQQQIQDQAACIQQCLNAVKSLQSSDTHPPVQHLLDVVNLPKVSLMTFDGSPLNYHMFMTCFDNVVHSKFVSYSTKLNLLLEHCIGKAAKLIQCCTLMSPEEGYNKARELLAERFGNDYTISEAWVNKICIGPPIKHGTDLQEFVDNITTCMETLRAMNKLDHIDSQLRMVQMVNRLPYQLQGRWRQEAVRTKERHGTYPTMSEFVSFLKLASQETNDPVFGYLPTHPQRVKQTRHKSFYAEAPPIGVQGTQPSASQVRVSPSAERNKVCQLCQSDHTLASCTKFHEMDAVLKLQFVKENKLCYNCLKFGRHRARYCRVKDGCNTCKLKHNTLLHEAFTRQPSVAPKPDQKPDIEEGSSFACGTDGSEKIALPIVPVRVRATTGGKCIQTYALLDPGSNKTFCSSELVNLLELEGKEASLSLSTLNDTKESSVHMVELEVRGSRSKNLIHLSNVYAIDTFPSLISSMASPDELRQWQHLKDISLPQVPQTDMEVLLLIGQDVPQAMMPLEVRHGQDYEPYAVRTQLGWVINGPIGHKSQAALCNFIHSVPVCQVDDLSRKVEAFWKMDQPESEEQEMSIDDKRVLDIWDKSLQKLENGHYQIAIPFCSEGPQLPNNRGLAERRLNSLGRRLSRDPDLLMKYKMTIDDLLDKGYAEPVPDDELAGEEGKIWYLPHHSVANPNKPKIRVVFDCSAEYKGTSLNKTVLQGPDMTNTLLGVLLRFREQEVGIMADIESMFHQVHVPSEQRDVLRFLWWTNGPGSSVKEFRMTVHLFGGIWSPSAANYALHRTALDQRHIYSDLAVETVLHNFYMDDCLKSIQDEDVARQLVRDLCEMLQGGGFRLTKWISNSKAVMESIPEEDRAKDVKDLNLPLPVERALGVQWRTSSDEMGIKVKENNKPLTRRGLLSVMSSVYDPLGFTCPFIVQAKMIFQEECRTGKSWDSELEPQSKAKWEKWLHDMHILQQFSIERCVIPSDFGQVQEAVLHHFCDASMRAYGVISYLRLVDDKGSVHCSFMLAKSRLAPLKTMTIPRLELSAAVVAVHIDAKLKRELTMKLGLSQFWTDSSIVLQYVKNTTKRFKTFVSNRVSIIHQGSDPAQWHHIDTSINPADDISRGLGAEKLVNSERWRHGPKFLWQDENTWPMTEVTPEVPDDDEVKLAKTHAQMAEPAAIEEPFDKFLHARSCWFKLRKAVCWLQRFIAWLPHKEKNAKDIQVAEIDQAEKHILKYLQRKYYQVEITSLQKGVKVSKKSPIYSLEPTLDDDGLLRVGGRLVEAPVSYDARHPVVLPRDHYVTRLVVRYIHKKAGHCGREHVLSLVREKYWIPKARPVVREVLRKCVLCKKLSGKMASQMMADLPKDRLTPYKPPFTYVGIDCFGPFMVKRGRGQEKRYGCLFTCLTTRAVHLEMLSSLDSDAFINALIRFCARRGVPEKIRSDNATNFVGSLRELSDKTKKHLLMNNISWEFNPPAASHMGGVWERQIRSVRKTMNAILRNQTLDDERLQTLFAEAEAIINSRPLTYNSDDPKDESPITPNHILLLRNTTRSAGGPGPFAKDEVRRWRHVQFLADCFWRRWLKEYLPTLQLRQKWLQPKRDIQPGDVVLVEDATPRREWPLARVLKTFSGRDGRVRSAEVKTKSSVLTRPIHKLCLLEGVN